MSLKNVLDTLTLFVVAGTMSCSSIPPQAALSIVEYKDGKVAYRYVLAGHNYGELLADDEKREFELDGHLFKLENYVFFTNGMKYGDVPAGGRVIVHQDEESMLFRITLKKPDGETLDDKMIDMKTDKTTLLPQSPSRDTHSAQVEP